MIRKFVFAAPLLLAASTAMAGSVTFSDAYGPTQTDFNATLTLNKFNSALGNLTSVVFKYDIVGQTTITAENTSNNPIDFEASTVVKPKLVANDAGVAGVIGNGLNFTATSDSTGSHTIDAGDRVTFDPLNYSGSKSQTYTSGLSVFAGSAGATYTFDASTLTAISAIITGSNVLMDQVTDATVTLTVTYNYDLPVVPEPSSVIMLGLAGGIVGVTLRFRGGRA